MMRSWKAWAGVGVSILFLYIAFNNINWNDFIGSLKTIRLWPVLAVMAIVVLLLIVRGYRWTFFLKPVKRVSPITLFWSTTIGFALNNILPARLGEVGRAYSAHKQADVPFGSAFGTIVVERLYDSFSALFLFVLTLIFVDFPNFREIFGVTQGKVAGVLGALVVAMIAFIFLLKWKTDFMVRVMRLFLKPVPEKYTDKIVSLFRSFVDGLTQTTSPKDVAWIIILSILMWVISGYTMYLCVLAFDVDLTFDQTVILLMSILIAVAIPAAPGYAGTYHYLAQRAMVIYVHTPASVALSIAVVIHAANYIPQTLIGLSRFAYEGIKVEELKDIKKQSESHEQAT